MEFKSLKDALQKNFKKLTENETHLFEVEVNKEHMWEIYLDSFPNGTNPIYRERREYDCNCCKNFIRNIGNAVVIKDNEIKTIWDFKVEDDNFQVVINAMDTYIKSKLVSNIYVSKFSKIGTDRNFEQKDGITVDEWHHFYLELPNKFVDSTERSEGDIKGSIRDVRNVFKRSLDELTEDSVLTVLELIASNTLYKGSEWEQQLKLFLQHKKAYSKLKSDLEKENYAWEQAVKVGGVIGKIRNHSIGTLLINISEEMDLDAAVRKYESIVAPSNYKRPKAIYTQRMLEDAQKKITEMGYMESLPRRHSRLEDITVNNVLFSNKDSAKKLGGFNIFDDMKKDVAIDPKKFSKVETVEIDKFINNVLPMAKEVEVLLENKHINNMVSLIAPQNKDSKTMFKWDNNFSWAYAGNITDSSMKEQVIAKGGRVDGVLRMSSSWNHEGKRNQSLMDFHVFLPDNLQHNKIRNGVEVHDSYGNKDRVGWNNRKNYETGGSQDVDYVQVAPVGYVPIENITFPRLSDMPEGVYTFKAHNWSFRGTANGFKCEIEFSGTTLEFDYYGEMKNKEWITIARIELKNGQWTVLDTIECKQTQKEIWNLKSNQFVPVSIIMYSPNYWNEQDGIGNKHYMFMLKDCINPESPNGFYNEFLNHELNDNRKVMEALGSKMRVQDTDNQLSGLGFSSTRRNELVVKVKGKTERVIKVTF